VQGGWMNGRGGQGEARGGLRGGEGERVRLGVVTISLQDHGSPAALCRSESAQKS